MTIRKDSIWAASKVAAHEAKNRLSGLLHSGGRTHNYSATDLEWEDPECPDCGLLFVEGEELVMAVTRLAPGRIFTAPVHRVCPPRENNG